MRPTEIKSKILHKCQLLLLSFLYWGFRYLGMILPLILNYFISLLPFQWHSYKVFHMCCTDLCSLLFFLCFFLFFFFYHRGMLRDSLLHPSLFSKAEGWSDANSAIFIPQSNRGNVKLAVGTAAFYDFYFIFLRQSYSTTWLVGAEINKLSKVTEPRIELGFLSHQWQFKIFFHLL